MTPSEAVPRPHSSCLIIVGLVTRPSGSGDQARQW
jgi:hypothetical protein